MIIPSVLLNYTRQAHAATIEKWDATFHKVATGFQNDVSILFRRAHGDAMNGRQPRHAVLDAWRRAVESMGGDETARVVC